MLANSVGGQLLRFATSARTNTTLNYNAPMRLAWFTPLPPLRTGIAAYSAEVLRALSERAGEQASPSPLATPLEIDVYVDSDATARAELGWTVHAARDFVWRNVRHPYDLVVYQLGNSPAHDYMWPYLVRFPGLVVLHDAQLHHSRALSLLTHGRHTDYRTEFAFCHSDARPGVADAVMSSNAGFLFYIWPLVRVPVDSARMVAVHTPGLAALLHEQFPKQDFDVIRMGVADAGGPDSVEARHARKRVLARHGVPSDALVFAAYGMATPEKRLPEILRGLRAVRTSGRSAHLLIVGDTVDHYDVRADARALGVEDHVTITGYVRDEDLADYLHAADVALSLRWPTSRETSAAWLRCLAAGKPTVITDLVHNGHVPALDPRTWQRMATTTAFEPSPAGARLESSASAGGISDSGLRTSDSGLRTSDSGLRTSDSGLRTPDYDPVCVAIDILDEQHSLGLAMRRLVADAELRQSLGRAARRYWQAQHTVECMAVDYLHVIGRAVERPVPDRSHLPAHLLRDASEPVREVLEPFGVSEDQLGWGR